MLRNLNMKMMIAAASLALGVAGCLGGSPSGGSTTTTGGSGTATDPGSLGIAGAATTDTSETGGINNTFDHPTEQDPFAILQRVETEGAPAVSTKEHSCAKMKYATVGHVLSALGVNLANKTATSGGAIYTAASQSMGAPDYAARVSESLELTTAGATKLFDILTESAPEIIVGVGKATSCMTAGTPAAIFGADGKCAVAGLSCIQGYPATQAQVDLCNNILTSASTPTIGQTLAVATLMSAAHSCE
jgi:hypothetical protein